jgi:hypothetical protein
MTRFGWLVVLSILGLLILGTTAFFLLRDTQELAPVADIASTTPAIDPGTVSIYTNGEYGFSFVYPASARILDDQPATMSPWRTRTGNGVLIVSVVGAEGEVLVGMSSDKAQVAACTKLGSSEVMGSPEVHGSTTWSVFTSEKLGTEVERLVTSYRTVRDDSCYAVEVFSNPDAVPQSGYTIRDIITSFAFAT